MRLSDKIKAGSFDVFDTVLVRDVGLPEHIFILTGRELRARGIANIEPTFYRTARVVAERMARQNSAHEEITLAEIFKELEFALDLPRAATEAAMAIEQELELKSLQPNPEMVSRVKAAHGQFGRVLFISDMYLPEETIKAVLFKHDILQANDRLYLSNRHRLQKVTGKLFRLMLETESLRPEELHHVGDNEYADVAAARTLGISVEHYTGTALTRWEQFWNEQFENDFSHGCSIGGLVRLARLHSSNADPDTKLLSRVATGVAAPFLTGYCWWVLQRAVERGWTDLYFVSRDGEILLEIARRLQARLGFSQIRLRYLHGSREAWYAAKVPELNPEAWKFLCRRICHLAHDAKDCLKAVGLQENQKALALAVEKGFGNVTTDAQKEGLYREVIALPEFMAEAETFLRRKRHELLGYLVQEGLAGRGKCALVDTGWTGVWTDGVGDLLHDAGHPRPGVALIGVLDMGFTLNGEVDAYLFDGTRAAGPYKSAWWLYRPTEMFTVAGHGRTVGYRLEMDQWLPVVTETKLDGLRSSALQHYRECVYKFAELFGERIKTRPEGSRFKLDSLACVTRFWQQPSMEDTIPFLDYATGLSYDRNSDQRRVRHFVGRDVIRALWGEKVLDEELWLPACWLHSRPLVARAVRVAVKVREKVNAARQFLAIRHRIKNCFFGRMIRKRVMTLPAIIG